MPLADSAEPYSDDKNENGIYISYQMIMILYRHLLNPSTRSILLVVSFKLKYTYQKRRNEIFYLKFAFHVIF